MATHNQPHPKKRITNPTTRYHECPFPVVLPNIGMRRVPNILPSVKFPNFGNVSCFSCFSCFSWKNTEKSRKKHSSIRTALSPPPCCCWLHACGSSSAEPLNWHECATAAPTAPSVCSFSFSSSKTHAPTAVPSAPYSVRVFHASRGEVLLYTWYIYFAWIFDINQVF